MLDEGSQQPATPLKEGLEALKDALLIECDAVIEREGQLDKEQIANWAIQQRHSLVVAALIDIMCQALEQRWFERRHAKQHAERLSRLMDFYPEMTIDEAERELQLRDDDQYWG
jgi:hypothetical protein